MTSPAALSGHRFVALLDRVGELNDQVSDLARHISDSTTTRAHGQLLGLTLDRTDRRLAQIEPDRIELGELCELFTDMSAVQTTLRKHAAAPMNFAPGRIFESLARLRSKSGPEEVLRDAPTELCTAGGFDRTMISGVHGSMWSPRLLFLSDGQESGFNRELSDYIAELSIPLASPMLEAEVVRRRLSALVQDAQVEPRTFRPLMEVCRTREYVVAPIIASGAVVGLLHADTFMSQRPLTVADRDCLRSFAEGVGVIYERMVLEARLERQRDCVDGTLRAISAGFAELGGGPAPFPGPAVRSAVAIVHDSEIADRAPAEALAHLTAREKEVMDLLASGATNAQVADRLTVAESTVKSHVKHILHKTGATNRAGAIARYVRASRVERQV